MQARRLVLRSLTGETFTFEPGALCLELALTGGEGYRAAYEQLHAPEDLAVWLEAFTGARAVPVDDEALAAARGLREAVWASADARADGLPAPAEAVDEANRRAAAAPLIPRLTADGKRAWSEPVTGSQVLSTVARDLIDLLSGPRADRIRRCGGENCTLLFLDTSPAGRRRWCSMERCGNRAKVRAFRSRRQEEPRA